MFPSTLPPVSRPFLRLFALALPFLALPALHASTITYDVTLTPTSGPYGGSGTLTIASPPANSGISTFSQADGSLQGLSFTVDNQTFSLSGYPGATVEFLDGQLYNIGFAQTVGASPNRFTLDTSGVYAFYYNNGQSESAGSITASLADTPSNPSSSQPPTASATPEPGTLILLATALIGGGFFVFRRARQAHS
jgi:PEP-CTERM motif